MPSQRPRRLLVADPSEELRGYVRDGVSDLGLEVFEAEDGGAALQVADAVGPDLVLANHRLGGLGGLGLARRFAESGGPPVVVMGPVSETEAREAGALGVLPKPFDRARLRKRLAGLVKAAAAAEGATAEGEWSAVRGARQPGPEGVRS